MVAPAFLRRALFVAAMLLVATTTSAAGEVNLSWDPSATASGYKVYHGASSGLYTVSDDVENTTTTPVNGLPDCATRYFAVTAYNAAGESGYSSEVASWPRAVFTSADPAIVERDTQVSVTISGTNFRDVDTIGFSNPGVQIDAATATCSVMTLTLTIAANAQLGPVDISVTHPSGVTGTGVGVLTVAADEDPPVITGVQATAVDGTSAVINWTTDEPSDSQVFVRKQGDQLYLTMEDSTEVTDHAVTVTGLEPEMTYEYHVSSTDAAGNTSTTSPDDTFTTTSSLYSYLRFEAPHRIRWGAPPTACRFRNPEPGTSGCACTRTTRTRTRSSNPSVVPTRRQSPRATCTACGRGWPAVLTRWLPGRRSSSWAVASRKRRLTVCS
jgi:hypothetical protein